MASFNSNKTFSCRNLEFFCWNVAHKHYQVFIIPKDCKLWTEAEKLNMQLPFQLKYFARSSYIFMEIFCKMKLSETTISVEIFWRWNHLETTNQLDTFNQHPSIWNLHAEHFSFKHLCVCLFDATFFKVATTVWKFSYQTPIVLYSVKFSTWFRTQWNFQRP